ncbi:MAG: hypothetical protein Ct9H300mP16_14190 [Pseudomonadota bacterium]|nr:MAG: hypothetical protein Ct9H300mP16_14190 [Pseudomonadota bacterium]
MSICVTRAHLRMGLPIRTHITDLARSLGDLGMWIRLHYVYPYPHVDDLVSLMAEGLVLPYLDVPFQHSNPRILKLMKRPASGEDNLARIPTGGKNVRGWSYAVRLLSDFLGRRNRTSGNS